LDDFYVLKFRHSEKATKIWNNLSIFLTSKKWKIDSNICGLLRISELYSIKLKLSQKNFLDLKYHCQTLSWRKYSNVEIASHNLWTDNLSQKWPFCYLSSRSKYVCTTLILSNHLRTLGHWMKQAVLNILQGLLVTYF
jgi:hypothetical protein